MRNKPPVTPLSRTYTKTYQNHPTVHTISYTLLQPRRSTSRPPHTQAPLLANHLLRLSKIYPPTLTLKNSQKSNKKSNIRFTGYSRLSTSTIQSRICRPTPQRWDSILRLQVQQSTTIYVSTSVNSHIATAGSIFFRFTILFCVLDHFIFFLKL